MNQEHLTIDKNVKFQPASKTVVVSEALSLVRIAKRISHAKISKKSQT